MSIPSGVRDVSYRCCFDNSYTPQTSITNPVTSGINATFQINQMDSPDLIRTIDTIMDCSRQFEVNQQTISEYQRFTINFDADPQSLGWAFAGVMGAATAPTGSGTGPFTSALSMLGLCTFRLPYTAIVLQAQCANPSDPGVVFGGVVINKLTITAQFKQRVRVSAEIFAAGPIAASGFTAPACSPINPLRLDQGVFTVNGISRINPNSGDPHTNTESVVFTYDNGILTDLTAFPLASSQPQAWERANVRPITLDWKVMGYLNDSLDAQAVSDPRTFFGNGSGSSAFQLQLGSGIQSVSINSGYAMLTRQDKALSFDGQGRISYLNLQLRPTLDSNNDLPLTGVVVDTVSSGFLQ
jgi:hypothetical protein